MIKLTALADAHGTPSDTVTLTFEERSRSRRRVRLGSGYAAFLSPPRGAVLRHGDLVASEDGVIVEVRAASETVSIVHSADARALTRVAYHLGNRHVALEVGEGFVAYLHDHVLDDMVRALGLSPGCEQRPFEPEGGAYGAGGAHGHGHGRQHEHEHEHAAEHEHAHDAEHEHGGRARSHAHD